MLFLMLFFLLFGIFLISLILLIVPLTLITIGTISLGVASIAGGVSKKPTKGISVFIYTATGLLGTVLGATISFLVGFYQNLPEEMSFASANITQIVIWAVVGCGIGLLMGKFLNWIFKKIYQLILKIKERKQ